MKRRRRRTHHGKKHSLYCTIGVGTGVGADELGDVPCKIVLPNHGTGTPKIYLYPNLAQFKRIELTRQLSFVAMSEDTVFKSTVLYADSRMSQRIYTEFNDVKVPDHNVIKCRPRDLSVAVSFKAPHSRSGKTHVTFWLTPNSWLEPDAETVMYADGSITVDRVQAVTAQLSGGEVVTFQWHFEYAENGGSITRRPSLVAEMNVDVPATDTAGILKIVDSSIDDLLLLVSFASRTQTACVGWRAFDATSLVTYYRKDRAVPRGEVDDGYGDPLVSKRDRQEFLANVHRIFADLPNRDAVRWTLYRAMPLRGRSIEWRFLSVFAGIEHLVLDFKDRVGLKHTLRGASWKRVRRRIGELIDKDEEISSQQAAWIIKKLPELNRVPIEDVLDRLCREYDLDLSDLWPLLGSEADLVRIRNWIVHAEKTPEALWEDCFFAVQNLGWIFERLVLTILKWPAAGSGAGRAGVSSYYASSNWPAAKERLANWWRSADR